MFVLKGSSLVAIENLLKCLPIENLFKCLYKPALNMRNFPHGNIDMTLELKLLTLNMTLNNQQVIMT